MRFAEAIALSIVWVSSPPVHDASQKRWRPGTVESEYSGQERGGERNAPRSGVGQVGEDGSARRQGTAVDERSGKPAARHSLGHASDLHGLPAQGWEILMYSLGKAEGVRQTE